MKEVKKIRILKNVCKEKNGITLIALIITIIVLLILAVVTISAVNEGNLFAHSNNAATAYSKAASDENTMISNYLSKLEEHDKSNQVSQTPKDDDSIIGTYYLASGIENATVTIIDDENLDYFGTILKYTKDKSNGKTIIYLEPDQYHLSGYTCIKEQDGTKILFMEAALNNGQRLLATDISKLNTGSLTGTYIQGSGNVLEFIDGTTLKKYKTGDPEEYKTTKSYKYFVDYNCIYIEDDDWYSVDENTIYNGNTYIKQ